MASWRTASGEASGGLAHQLNNNNNGGPSSSRRNRRQSPSVTSTPTSAVELTPTKAASAAMGESDCANCRKRTLVVDPATGRTVCTSASCHTYVAEQQVPNEEEDSSDESPLLSTVNSGQGSSNVSMNGGDHGGGADGRNGKRHRSGGGLEDDGEHCHSQATFSRMVARELRNQTVKNRLLGAVFLTLAFATGEFIAGWYVNSTAIRTDACHMFADVATLAVSYLSARLSSKKPSTWMNFGYARAEALGALVAIAVIYSIAVFVGLNAVQQIADGDFEVLSLGMMYAGGCAVVFNVFLFLFLRGLGVGHAHSHGGAGVHEGGSTQHTRFENQEEGHASDSGGDGGGLHAHSHEPGEQLNLRAAILHALGDILASSFVLAVAVVIYNYPSVKVLDPIAAIGIALLILKLLWSTLMDSCRILLNATPKEEDHAAIQVELGSISGVVGVHELRLFAVSTSIKVATVHLVTSGEAGSGAVRSAATRALRDRHNYDMVTVQVERRPAPGRQQDEWRNCVQCKSIGGGDAGS